MAVYVQLGTSGSFTAPASGALVLQCEDGTRTDNSGSLTVTIDGASYPVASASDSAGPTVAAGQTVEYSCPAGEYWNCGSGNVWFNADGTPKAGNDAQWTSQEPLDAHGLRPFSLVGRMDGAAAAAELGRRMFSTGVLEATADFGLGAQTLRFALVQDATITCRFQEKQAYGAAAVSAYAQATAYHDGQWSVKIDAGEFSTEAIQMLAALRAAQAGPGYLAEVIAGGALAPPASFSGTFTARAIDGRPIVWQFRKLLPKGASLPFKLNDFLYTGMELTAVGDASGGIVDLLVGV